MIHVLPLPDYSNVPFHVLGSLSLSLFETHAIVFCGLYKFRGNVLRYATIRLLSLTMAFPPKDAQLIRRSGHTLQVGSFGFIEALFLIFYLHANARPDPTSG
ncbi:hypothetical protein BJV82DRAFT_622504 [Fennellomyces sp. T-0311]|nr:hypothetical protein BJV82DRAFT_622504 [Fennellomyces sp. T-0311]